MESIPAYMICRSCHEVRPEDELNLCVRCGQAYCDPCQPCECSTTTVPQNGHSTAGNGLPSDATA